MAALFTAVGTFLSLTPSVRIGGGAVDLPQAWFAEWVPIYRAIRVPSRLGVTALVGLSLLAGLAFAECVDRLSTARSLRAARPTLNVALAVALVATMYLQYHARLPAELAGGSTYPIAATIGPDSPFLSTLRQPGGPLLEFPPLLSPPDSRPSGTPARCTARSSTAARS
jgi:hypothetical protein